MFETLPQRLLNVMKLDSETFEEIEHDEQALVQAMVIVVAVSLVSVIAHLIQQHSVTNMIFSSLFALLSWWVGSWIIYKLGTTLFAQEADATHSEMLRVLGFAQAPMLLAPIPYIGWLAGIWGLCTTFVAIRQGLDISNGQTLIVILVDLVVCGALVIGIVLAFASIFMGSVGLLAVIAALFLQ